MKRLETPREGRVLPRMTMAGPMPWVIAIMMFLTVLSAAAGLGLDAASGTVRRNLAQRLTIQVIEADPIQRDRQADAIIRALEKLPAVRDYRRLEQAALGEMLAPWLGDVLVESDLALPAMIDVDLASSGKAAADAVRNSVKAVAPAARIDAHGGWMAALDTLLRLLRSLSFFLILLLATATAFTVILASRAALDQHRDSIDVLHLLGATDVQVARLFQRQVARDALLGGLVGYLAASAVILLVGSRVADLGSEMLESMKLDSLSWLLLLVLPFLGVALSIASARLTILSTLRRMP